MFIKSKPDFKHGHVRLKTRSTGQIFKNKCFHSRRHSIDSNFITHCHKIQAMSGQKRANCVKSQKNRIYTLEDSFDLVFIKLSPNVCHHQSQDKFETGSCRVKWLLITVKSKKVCTLLMSKSFILISKLFQNVNCHEI